MPSSSSRLRQRRAETRPRASCWSSPGCSSWSIFSTATILARLGSPDKSVIAPGRPLETIYGPLSAGEVWAQMLTIPVALAVFGAAIVVVVSLAGA
jgi:hypothetical protein